MLNPFFQQGSRSEQSLIQSIINESIKIHGVDIYYIPRQYITKKTIIREVIESKFQHSYPIEAYVETYDGYGGQGTLMSKFGIQEMDDLTLIISKERYESYIQPLIKDLPKIELSSRPKEGDLIWFPLGNRLFEIKYVEHEKPFYQLQKNYVYELRCELFRYGNEIIDTGIENIDSLVKNEGYTQTLKLIGVGITASAVCSIFDGGVRFVTLSNRGTGYTSAPSVGFSSSPQSGGTSVGICSMIGGIVDVCEPDPDLLRVQSVEIINPGYGYTVAPKISFTGGGGSGAAATATIGNGVVGLVTLSSSGSGYVHSPSISFVGSATSVAIATCVVTDGVISSISLIDAGIGYTVSPQIIIGNPSMIGSGTFSLNEIVVGSISSTTAKVKNWNSSTNNLDIYYISGSFIPGEIITGQTSASTYVLKSVNIYNDVEKYDDNYQIQLESDKILDFSEKNPFGNP
jgi:hypothetical protein